MPKSSWNSVKIKSPPRDELIAALRAWAAHLKQTHPTVQRVGLFGSYARSEHTPASDVDILLVLSHALQPSPFQVPAEYYPPNIPVGCELQAYGADQIARRQAENDPWIKHLLAEVIWLA